MLALCCVLFTAFPIGLALYAVGRLPTHRAGWF